MVMLRLRRRRAVLMLMLRDLLIALRAARAATALYMTVIYVEQIPARPIASLMRRTRDVYDD